MFKVLIIDDDREITELLERFLKSIHYNVLVAHDGREGLKAVPRYLPDLIIMDLNMPYIDGLELSRLVKENSKTRQTPIVMITGEGVMRTMEQALRTGVDSFISKPIDFDFLETKIRALCEKAI